jgi:hypothetical protein
MERAVRDWFAALLPVREDDGRVQTEYVGACTMMHPDEYACPLCGLILPALAAYHRHYAERHGRQANPVLAVARDDGWGRDKSNEQI